MENVILVIHLILALSIIGLVLIQRSEGGGLGIGGGGGGLGGMASPRSTANALTRTTWLLAACFFVTSLTLGILAGTHSGGSSIIDSVSTDDIPSIEGAIDVNALNDASSEMQDITEQSDIKMDEVPSVPVSE